jgi:hypothetical protein
VRKFGHSAVSVHFGLAKEGNALQKYVYVLNVSYDYIFFPFFSSHSFVRQFLTYLFSFHVCVSARDIRQNDKKEVAMPILLNTKLKEGTSE